MRPSWPCRSGGGQAEAAQREIEKPKVQRRGERKVRLEINAAVKAVRWLEGSDAATRMRWQARAEELGVTVPGWDRQGEPAEMGAGNR